MFFERSEVGKFGRDDRLPSEHAVHSDNSHKGCASTFAVVAQRRLGVFHGMNPGLLGIRPAPLGLGCPLSGPLAKGRLRWRLHPAKGRARPLSSPPRWDNRWKLRFEPPRVGLPGSHCRSRRPVDRRHRMRGSSLSKRHGIAGRDTVLALMLQHAIADVGRVIRPPYSIAIAGSGTSSVEQHGYRGAALRGCPTNSIVRPERACKKLRSADLYPSARSRALKALPTPSPGFQAAHHRARAH